MIVSMQTDIQARNSPIEDRSGYSWRIVDRSGYPCPRICIPILAPLLEVALDCLMDSMMLKIDQNENLTH